MEEFLQYVKNDSSFNTFSNIINVSSFRYSFPLCA